MRVLIGAGTAIGRPVTAPIQLATWSITTGLIFPAGMDLDAILRAPATVQTSFVAERSVGNSGTRDA
jgi:hypothetical protein